MPTVLEWGPTVDPSEFVRRVREVLGAGQLVVLPGDSGYVVLSNPASASAVIPLASLAANCAAPPSLLSYGPEDAAAYGIEAPIVAKRLMHRAWPAPLVVALPARDAVWPFDWPESTKQLIAADGWVRFRCPDHAIIEAVFPAIYSGGQCTPTALVDARFPTAEAVVEQFGESVGLAVSAGTIAVERPTEIRVEAGEWKLFHEGAFRLDEARRLAARMVLFVCTGNTCRSPMAEGLAKKLLSDRLSCALEELPARGFWLLSAGVAAYGGGPASPESVDVVAEFGGDLLSHRSRPVNPQLLAAADDIIAMTRGHALALTAQFPGIGCEPRLLCGEDDLDDPIGASLEVYRQCAGTIVEHLERHVKEWVPA